MAQGSVLTVVEAVVRDTRLFLPPRPECWAAVQDRALEEKRRAAWKEERARLSVAHQRVVKKRLAWLFSHAVRNSHDWLVEGLAVFAAQNPPGTRPEVVRLFRRIPKVWFSYALLEALCMYGKPASDPMSAYVSRWDLVPPQKLFELLSKWSRADLVRGFLRTRTREKRLGREALVEFSERASSGALGALCSYWACAPDEGQLPNLLARAVQGGRLANIELLLGRSRDGQLRPWCFHLIVQRGSHELLMAALDSGKWKVDSLAAEVARRTAESDPDNSYRVELLLGFSPHLG